MNSLSLVVPVHNGESFIQESLQKYHKVFSQKFNPFEIIVVCNACRDNTEDRCKEINSQIPLNILNVPARGKGHALIEGFSQANYNIVGFLDADNPFDLSEVLKMISSLNNFDMVIATKFKEGRLKYQTSSLRRVFSAGSSVVARSLFDLKFSDTQAGAKFMRKELWDKIDKRFLCHGFEFDMELLYRAQKERARIKEYFLLPKESDFSTVKMRILPGILWRLFKLRLLK